MRHLFTLLFMFAAVWAVAQDVTDTAGLSPSGASVPLPVMSRDLSEVTVTAYHNPERLVSAAGAVTVLPADSLRLGAHNIVTMLSSGPGLVIQEATPGTMKITMRGIGSRYPYGTRKIKMFFDGIPLYSVEGETWFDDIGPESVSRIEVLRGPSSSIYGASLGGTVILYPASNRAGRGTAELVSSAGSFGYFKNSIRWTGGNEKSDVLLSASVLNYAGYRENSRYLRQSMMLSATHRFGGRLSGTLLLFGSHSLAGIPSSIDSLAFVTDPRSAAPTWLRTRGEKEPFRLLSGYRMKYVLSKRWDFTASVHGSYRTNTENRPFNFLGESGYSFGGRFLARYSGKAGSASYNIAAGTEQYFELYNNSIHENRGAAGLRGLLQQRGKELIRQSDLFGQASLTLSDFTVSAGLNFNESGFRFTDRFSSDTIDQSGSYSFKPVLSPRLSLAWSHNRELTVYLAVNNGFSIPSLSETMTPLGLINRAIRPEKAWSYEGGLRMDLPGSGTFADISVFYMKVEDLIVPKRTGEDFYVGMNAGASLHRGVEIELRQRLWGRASAGSSADITMAASLGRYRFLDFSDGTADYSGKTLPGVPGYSLNGSFDLSAGRGLSFQGEVLSYGKMALNDENSGWSAGWVVLNARAGYVLHPLKHLHPELSVTLGNLTNEKYASMIVVNAPGTPARGPRYYYPGQPRSLMFTLALRYGPLGGDGKK